MTSLQDGFTRTAGSGDLLKPRSYKQSSAVPAACRPLPAAGEPPSLLERVFKKGSSPN